MNDHAPAEAFLPPIPAHIPPEMVRNYDLSGRAHGVDPYEQMASFRQDARVFFNQTFRPGLNPTGVWVLTHSEDIRAGLQQPELFSSVGTVSFSAMVGEDWPLIPLEIDPPDHGRYRAILNGIFSPKKMAAMEDGVRAKAVELIEAVLPKGECEFVEDFGRSFPVSIFMQLMGLPEDHTERFNQWEFALLHSDDMGTVMGAAHEIVAYLRALIAKRKVEPADDLTTFCINAKVEGRPVTDDEIMGMCFLLFIAGLDTVAASLGLHFRHLALNPAEQERLRANPDLIPDAVEEFLRRYSIVNSSRFVAYDTEFAGAPMKKGDRVLFSTILANLDPQEFEAPLETVIDRAPNRHVSFMFGPHRCIGSHLARRELVIAMEEWLKRAPTFRIKDGGTVDVQPGGLLSVHELPLEW
jgi:cytochrome P450